MIGRRVSTTVELERGGDYCLVPDEVSRVNSVTQEPIERRPTIWFLLPGALDDDAPPGRRSRCRITSPPWTFRECEDGSVEVRASIAVGVAGEPDYWHGFLDEGHVWRQV